LTTKTSAGPHIEIAFAMRTRASGFAMDSILAWFEAFRDAWKTFLAAARLVMPPTSARISMPFLKTSMASPLRIFMRIGEYIYRTPSECQWGGDRRQPIATAFAIGVSRSPL